jgi:hypothetical protein
MACYENIVGIRGLCDNPTIRYYVDDWGVSLKTAANIADEKYLTGKKLFEAKRKQAWDYLVQDVVLKGFKHDKILKSFSIQSAGGTPINGVGVINLDFTDNCELTGVFIDKIIADVITSGNVTIKINGTTVYSGPLPIGKSTIVVGKVFAKALTIDISGTAVMNGGTGNYYTDGVSGCYSVGETYGLSITGDYRCMIEQYLCRFPDKIGMALAIKTAALMTKEMLTTAKLAEILFVKDRQELITELASLDSSENLYVYDGGDTSTPIAGKYQKQIEYINRVIPVPKCKCCMDAVRSSYNLSIP